MRTVLAGLALLSLIALPASAQELSEEDRRVARDHFERGTLAFERGDYGEASAEFRAAYALTQHADLLYNIYSAQERNGELVEAAEALEGYLRDGDPEEARREALELRLERLRLRTEQASLEAARADAQASEEREAAAAELAAEQGERAAAEQRAAAERAGRLDQVRAGHATADALVVTGVVVMAAGGLGLASFGVFAGLSESEDQALATSCGSEAGRVCRESDTETLSTFNTAADVSWIVGAGLAIAGGVIVLIGESLRPGEAAGGEARARLVPIAGPNVVGASVDGVW